MKTRELTVRTGSGRGLFDLTGECAAFAADAADGGDGLLSVFVPHATAGLVIVEIGAGSDDDLLAALDRLLPREERLYRHRHGSPGHGADHVLPLLVPPSLTVPVVGGQPGSRDVAVDLSSRPEPGQRDTDRPPRVPGRLTGPSPGAARAAPSERPEDGDQEDRDREEQDQQR